MHSSCHCNFAGTKSYPETPNNSICNYKEQCHVIFTLNTVHYTGLGYGRVKSSIHVTPHCAMCVCVRDIGCTARTYVPLLQTTPFTSMADAPVSSSSPTPASNRVPVMGDAPATSAPTRTPYVRACPPLTLACPLPVRPVSGAAPVSARPPVPFSLTGVQLAKSCG